MVPVFIEVREVNSSSHLLTKYSKPSTKSNSDRVKGRLANCIRGHKLAVQMIHTFMYFSSPIRGLFRNNRYLPNNLS